MEDGSGFFMVHPHFLRISWLLPTLYGPFILLFTNMITKKRQQFVKTDILVFIPFIVYLIALFPFYMRSGGEKAAIAASSAGIYGDDFGIFNQVTNFLHLFFLFLSMLVYNRNLYKWKRTYSNPDIIRTRWLFWYLMLILLVLSISVLVFYSKKFSWEPFTGWYPYHFLGVVTMLYWVGYKALIQPAIFTIHREPGPDIELRDESPKYETYLLDTGRADRITDKMIRAMTRDRLFLNPDLSLSDLAGHIDASRHHISQVLNQYLSSNFYEFINRYRVEEFKAQAGNPENHKYTLLSLAYMSGFNSKATFHAIFKKFTGMTPSAYLKGINSAEKKLV